MEQVITRTEAGETVEASELSSKDRIHEVLSNPRRRQAIRYLRAQPVGAEVSIRELSERIAAWENDTTVEGVTYKQRKRVYTSLYQSHLPKLSSYGFVEYDQNRGLITLTQQGAELDVYLEVVPKGDLTWSDFWFGLSVIAFAFVVAAWAGTLPYLGGIVVAFLISTAFLLASAVHVVYTRRNRLFD
jgi:DNA-binding transcriptional ArsR family regulator